MFCIYYHRALTLSLVAVFVVQFLLLSLAFGIPLLTFFISTGQYLGSGIIDMWRISPIFQVELNSLIVTLCSLCSSLLLLPRVLVSL